MRGGLYGEEPGLAEAALVDWGNLDANVDARSVMATVLDDWLGADADAVIGGHFPTLGCLNAPT